MRQDLDNDQDEAMKATGGTPRTDRTAGGAPALVAALVLLALHAWWFGGWMIDDAGITFAYARNAAAGHGLVAQPGAAPVEGYSNPLWTLLIAALYGIGAFSLALTPKIVAFALTAVAVGVVFRDLRATGRSRVSLTAALVTLAACTPFVIWTMSGLENALLAALVTLACANTLASVRDHVSTARRDATAGVLSALLALTRPDAILYLGAHAVSVAALEWTRGSGFIGRTVRRWVTQVATFVPVFGSYLAFRVFYFGDVVPNTYHAKQKPSPGDLLSPGKLFDLIESATGDFAWLVPFFVVGALGLVLVRGLLPLRLVVLGAYLAVATAIYLVMPPDWMGEFRFATAFFPLMFWTFTELAGSAAPLVGEGVQRASRVAVVLFVAHAFVVFGARSLSFASNPPVPLSAIHRYGAQGFDTLASIAQAPNASVLTSDLGGMLLHSKLRVIDLAGLCDKTVAKAISISGDPSRLHEYVFSETKPTFMHVVGAFVRLSRFHGDARFERDYVPIYETWDGPPEWRTIWKDAPTVPPFIGDYVRRDVLGDDPGRLDALRRSYTDQAMQRSVGPWQVRRDGVDVQRPIVLAAAIQVYGSLKTAAGNHEPTAIRAR